MYNQEQVSGKKDAPKFDRKTFAGFTKVMIFIYLCKQVSEGVVYIFYLHKQCLKGG